jgi:hypothetical protein
LPKNLAEKLLSDTKFRKSISKAINRVNCQGGGFAPKYGGGIAKFVPAIAILLVLANGSAQADEIVDASQNYLQALQNNEDTSADAAILTQALNNFATGSGYVALPTLLDAQ